MEKQKMIDLVTKAQNGDPKALNDLFKECYQDIYYFALKTVKNEDIAADITQESCLEISRTIQKLNEPAAFAVWVRRITYHQCTRFFKQQKDIIPEENEEGESIFDTIADESDDVSPEKVYEDKEFKATMRTLVDSLPNEQSAALLLYYYEKLSVQQIAEIQGVSEGTVKSRLNYARKAFKKEVENYEKKTGVRLHSAAPIAILLYYLFKDGYAETPLLPFALPNIGAGAATAATTAVGGGVAGTVGTGAAVTATATTTAGGLSVLTVVCSVIAAAAVAAAGFFGVKAVLDNGKNPPPASADTTVDNNNPAGTTLAEHTHETSDEWIILDKTHYKLCVGCNERVDEGEHTVSQENNGCDYFEKCTVCGWVSEITEKHVVKTTPDVWEKDDTSHYKLCVNCSEKLEIEEHNLSLKYDADAHYMSCMCSYIDEASYAPHSFVDGVCSCGYAYVPYELIFEPNSDNKSYRLSGIRSLNQSDVIIPDSYNSLPVTAIGSYAFKGCNLSAISLPDSITSIGEGAFSGCTDLKEIVIPNGVTTIPASAFEGCTSLTTVKISDTVTSVEKGAFKDCSALSDINLPNGITAVGDEAFSGCSSIASVTLPDKLGRIPDYAFYGCTALKSIKLPSKADELFIGKYAFCGCSSLAGIDFPKNLAHIDEHAFENCTSLLSIVIPDNEFEYVSYPEVEAFTFAGCTALKSVTFENIAHVFWESAFDGCSSLKRLDLHNALIHIHENAFRGCTALSLYYDGTIEQWHNVWKFGSWGRSEMDVYCLDGTIDHTNSTHNFMDNWQHDELQHWGVCNCGVISEHMDHEGTAGYECFICNATIASSGLAYSETEGGYMVLDIGECMDTEIYIPSTYNGQPVVAIGGGAFENRTNVTKIVIPDSVRNIGSCAFLGTAITEITIPDGVTAIWGATFAMCESLVSVNLPDSVEIIGESAFNECKALSQIDLSNVKTIERFAFASCSSLTETTLSDTLIQDSAFERSGLVNVTVTGNSEIWAAAFSWCESLKSVRLPVSVTTIDVLTFKGCTALEHIYYEGTIAQWNAIEKDDYAEDMPEDMIDIAWNKDTGEYTIHCSNGDLSK